MNLQKARLNPNAVNNKGTTATKKIDITSHRFTQKSVTSTKIPTTRGYPEKDKMSVPVPKQGKY